MEISRIAIVVSIFFLGQPFLLGCDTSETEGGVEVIKYRGDDILPEDIGSHGAWSVTVDSVLRLATLKLVQPDSIVRHELTLIEVDGDLPAYAGYRYHPGSEGEATLRSGRIEVQAFHLDGEISGVFEGSLSKPIGMRVGGVFFVNLAEEPMEATPADY